jgi:hypothetical protein
MWSPYFAQPERHSPLSGSYGIPSTNEIADAVAGQLNPIVEATLSRMLTVIEGKLNEVAPRLQSQAVSLAEGAASSVLNKMWPTIESKAKGFIGQYETKYFGVLSKIQKYSKPALFGFLFVGGLVTVASAITIRKAIVESRSKRLKPNRGRR